MRTDYISRQKALEAIKSKEKGLVSDLYCGMMEGLSRAFRAVRDVPAADAVQVIRCKDCMHYHPSYCEVWSVHGTVQTRENGYCYMAEPNTERNEGGH